MSQIIPIKTYDNQTLDIAAIGQLGVCVMWISDIPVAELDKLPIAGMSVYMQLWAFKRALEYKMAELEHYQSKGL